mmetsp:Transcript_6359/g.15713  ORF Transcript_6359/g.15713 Transcript_6359/m.15713 type:complete len:713 (-) Transcript_6359:58-2196(-)
MPRAMDVSDSQRAALAYETYTLVNVDALEKDVEDLLAREADIVRQIADFNKLWESRRFPLDQELADVRKHLLTADEELQRARRSAEEGGVPPAPGPASLAWVDSAVFGVACNLVVALNLTAMAFAPRFKDLHTLFKVLDHVFLTWYVFELSMKIVYHQQNLFCGKLSHVLWSWLDLGIVLGGIVDQWLLPVAMMLAGSKMMINTSVLSWLRLLRLFRVLRALKLLRAFFAGDMKWTESPSFELFMSGVIAVNSVVMALELDFVFFGWMWVENAFLTIYAFELIVRFKRLGCKFFLDDVIWNMLDLAMVVGGVMDLWLLPGLRFLMYEVTHDAGGMQSHSNLRQLMSLLKLMRIMRVLRLVRLLKAVKPLYRLLLGVIQSFKAMQWVLLLTFLMLYAGAIFWTSLVGHGLVYGGAPPKQGREHFGTVTKSLFSLFRLMNGDMSVVSSISNTPVGQVLFAAFMVILNWAILAILTSVVSDNMISASSKAQSEDLQNEKLLRHVQRVSRLRTLFKEMDKDHSGAITEEEWNYLFQDAGLLHELIEVTSLGEHDLHELFRCLCVDSKTARSAGLGPEVTGQGLTDRLKGQNARLLYYEAFIEHLKDDSMPMDKRCMAQLRAQLHQMQRDIDKRFDEMWHVVMVQSPAVKSPSAPEPAQPTRHEDGLCFGTCKPQPEVSEPKAQSRQLTDPSPRIEKPPSGRSIGRTGENFKKLSRV